MTRDRGGASVLAITCCVVFMTGVTAWFSSTVDRSLHDRADAAAVAFQAARSGAQAVDAHRARQGVLVLDPAAARTAARSAAVALFAANGDTGTVDAVAIDGRRVTVTVTITTTGRPATATATAVARPGVDRPQP